MLSRDNQTTVNRAVVQPTMVILRKLDPAGYLIPDHAQRHQGRVAGVVVEPKYQAKRNDHCQLSNSERMWMSQPTELTQLLHRVQQGDRVALEQLAPLIYNELRQIAQRSMRGERGGHTLQPTALVNEALLRLLGAETPWQDRVHFFAVAARQMRHILVDYARNKQRQKRGGGATSVSLDDVMDIAMPERVDIVELDDALQRLASVDPRKHDIVELHYFGGLTLDETAQAMSVSPKTIQRELRLAEAWLYHAIKPNDNT